MVEAVDRQNVRVRQRGDGTRLPLEAGPMLRIGAGSARQNLDGHVAPKYGIAGAIDLAQTSGGDGGYQFVEAETESRGKLH
jgi:hypothetical protein